MPSVRTILFICACLGGETEGGHNHEELMEFVDEMEFERRRIYLFRRRDTGLFIRDQIPKKHGTAAGDALNTVKHGRKSPG